MRPARYPTCSTLTSAKVTATVNASYVDARRHTTAVTPEAATTAGTRNHNPNRNPSEPIAAQANNMVSAPPRVAANNARHPTVLEKALSL